MDLINRLIICIAVRKSHPRSSSFISLWTHTSAPFPSFSFLQERRTSTPHTVQWKVSHAFSTITVQCFHYSTIHEHEGNPKLSTWVSAGFLWVSWTVSCPLAAIHAETQDWVHTHPEALAESSSTKTQMWLFSRDGGCSVYTDLIQQSSFYSHCYTAATSIHYCSTVWVFWKRSLMVTKVICLIKNSNFVIIFTILKKTSVFIFILVMQSWIFSIITPVFGHMDLLKSL